MGTLSDLADLLHAIDGNGYGAYKKIKGAWEGPGFTLHVDHVQGDPYATPSRLRIHIPPGIHGIPDETWSSRSRRLGLCDFLLRAFRAACRDLPRVSGSGKSGVVRVSAESPRILERAGCEIGPSGLIFRFRVGLPAGGRRCFGHSAADLLTEHLPGAVEAFQWSRLNQDGLREWVRTAEDHAYVQALLAERGLVAFVRDGSVLPRRTGVSSEPLDDAVPFESPPELRVSLPTLHRGEVRGMGVPRGVTVITGGGFHGKTTVLEAIQHGVVPHIPGDGREWTVTVADAVKVRSEDGRAVTGVDLRPFIHDLPLGRTTEGFTTGDASGSTSLAADILESLEIGTSLLLMDEDTCATNLLVRDARMQELVREETITPLIDRVRELAERGVSTVLVTGGGGDYLDVADAVVLMEAYRPRAVTEEARRVAGTHPTGRKTGALAHPVGVSPRVLRPEGLDPRRRGKVRIRTRGTEAIEYGEERIDLSAVEQLVDYGEARGIGALFLEILRRCDGATRLETLVRRAVERARREGIAALEDSPEVALPRPQEVAKALSRLRSLEVEGAGPSA